MRYDRYDKENEPRNRIYHNYELRERDNKKYSKENYNYAKNYRNNSENVAPNKSPYLEMPSIIDPNATSPTKDRLYAVSRNKDLGSVIENLNNKLNNYIEFNHLEETYRTFKLDFVQLKKNMT